MRCAYPPYIIVFIGTGLGEYLGLAPDIPASYRRQPTLITQTLHRVIPNMRSSTVTPPAGLFVTGTDTGVGKTQIAAALAHHLAHAGTAVRVRKPVESGAPPGEHGLRPMDAITLNLAAGDPESLSAVCPFPLAAVASPQRAAMLQGERIHLRQLEAACLRDIQREHWLLVEGAGGFCSPLCDDGLNADLAARLALPVLVVVADRLGCINHTLLTLQAIAARGLTVGAIVLNQFGDQHQGDMANAEQLARWCAPPLLVMPASNTAPAWRGLCSAALTKLSETLSCT